MTTSGEKTRIVIVDDHPIVRQGLQLLIGQQPDLEVCGEAESLDDALGVIAELAPDLAIVDIFLKGSSGIDLIKKLRDEQPKLRILVISMHDESIYAQRVLNAGANGYIMKQEATRKVVEAIRRVLKGEIYLSEKMIAAMLQCYADPRTPPPGASPVSRLTNRELQVFELLGRGFSSREIAEKLELSIKTVDTHRENIKEKMGIRNAVELVQTAVHWMMKESQGPGS
jgi:DNA-binding NarL/FixJ family response regulator